MAAPKNHRRSIRLHGYDYSQPGAYFVTLVTKDRLCLFGQIENQTMVSNVFGEIILEEWRRSAQIRHEIELDEYILMPNHFHAIVFIRAPALVGATGRSPRPIYSTHDPSTSPPGADGRSPLPCGPRPHSIGALIAGFKSASTSRLNAIRRTPGTPVWQRNYFEHIIRNDSECNRIRQYIESNPGTWSLDPENPI